MEEAYTSFWMKILCNGIRAIILDF